jgi:hypothetical protein
MARFNPNRAPAAKAIAAKLPALLAACKSGNRFDRAAIADASYAAQFFAAGDPTEHSRFEVYARAQKMLAHISHGAKYETALGMYAAALVAWSKDADYKGGETLAAESVAIAKAA